MTEPRINGVSLQQHIEALMIEQRRQLETASIEREKAAAELRDTQYRAMEQAEREREKAASAMRIDLERSRLEGDDRLREHISNQVQQIDAALKSAEKLEVQRLAAAESGVVGLRREMQLITEAARDAVIKSENAQQNVNDKSNEFRGQLADQAANLMPRKESESRTAELDRRVQLLERGVSGSRGEKAGSSATTATLIAVGVLFVSVVAVLANVLTG